MSLRISLSGEPCCRRGGKVRYRHKEGCVIAEELILQRWRERTRAATGEIFEGCRLRPNTWRVVSIIVATHGMGVLRDAENLSAALQEVYGRYPTLRATTPGKLIDVMAILRARGCLQQILERKRDEKHPGVPDLFLWRRKRDGQLIDGRFVEVKRWPARPGSREQVSPWQRDEMAFLTKLKLKARPVYIIDRWRVPETPSCAESAARRT